MYHPGPDVPALLHDPRGVKGGNREDHVVHRTRYVLQATVQRHTVHFAAPGVDQVHLAREPVLHQGLEIKPLYPHLRRVGGDADHGYGTRVEHVLQGMDIAH